MHPLPTRATGRAGVETSAMDHTETDGYDSQSLAVDSTVDLAHPVQYGASNYNQPTYHDDPQGPQGAYYDPYTGAVPNSLTSPPPDGQWPGAHPGAAPSMYAATGPGYAQGQESVYGARSHSPGPASAYGGRTSPGPSLAYSGGPGRSPSPGPALAYGAQPGRTPSPGPNMAYGGPPGRAASPGPNMAYGPPPNRTGSPGPNLAYGGGGNVGY